MLSVNGIVEADVIVLLDCIIRCCIELVSMHNVTDCPATLSLLRSLINVTMIDVFTRVDF